MSILAAIDHGLSGSKIIWTQPDGKIQRFEISPEIAYLSETPEEEGMQQSSKHDAWIKVGNEIVAVGSAAVRARGTAPLSESKFMPALYKSLCALGVLAELSDSADITVSLSTVLPYSEFKGDKETLIRSLKDGGKQFHFRGKKIKVTFDDVVVSPEATGVAQDYMAHNPKWKEEDWAVIMVGQRDLTVIHFETGRHSFHATQLGFQSVLDNVRENCGLNVTGERLSVLPALLYESITDDSATEKIAAMVSPRGISGKAEQIRQSLLFERKKYQQDLARWLQEQLSYKFGGINTVVCAGGAARFFREELEGTLKGKALHWGLYSANTSSPTPELMRNGDVFGHFAKLVASNGLDIPEIHKLMNTSTIRVVEGGKEEIKRGPGRPPGRTKSR